ncbi:hypothetical protein BY996DRAFT_4584490 [Phakopsora pachyrhizi]|uniref:J domain-containing protein n=1 Tax=Phakopsora pachyrhizi TaxID=170000 RepID=A0AAV0ARJ4_PHAPC|nr:hypothetical protein BY996DRAFT_4584490 [Phakopsora pachyrhizi]CAH7671110.1 hypothetical protein PPACK8108_LOCUS5872 [Phakopsora pachyrhizi]
MTSAFIALLGDLSPLMSFFGWWLLPGLLSGFVLGIFYRLRPSWRPLVPSATTTANQKTSYNPLYELEKLEHERKSRLHRTVAHGLVISIYLIYNLLNIYKEQDGTSYYSALGLKSNSLALKTPGFESSSDPSAATPISSRSKASKRRLKQTESDSPKEFLDEAGLKSHWRKLARSFHPDKINPPPELQTDEEISKWRDDVQSKFIGMREAYETLSDDAKKWAYDRFGPTVSGWKTCVTTKEFLEEGMKHSAPFWIFTIASLSLIGSLRKNDPGSFWRWLCLALILVSEFVIITSSKPALVSKIMMTLFPNRAPFQLIELLRQIFIASSSITTQLASILYPAPENKSKDESKLKEFVEPMFGLIEKMNESASLANFEVIKLVLNDLHPIIRSHHDHTSNNKSRLSSNTLIDLEEKFEQENGIENEKDVEVELKKQEKFMKETIEELKLNMLDTFCDLKLQSETAGQEAWLKAIEN